MTNIDFLPERVRTHRARRRRLRRQGYLLVVCALGLAILGYARHGRLARAEAELDMLLDRHSNMKCQLEARTALEQQLAELMLKKRIDEHLGSRIDALDVLAELGRVMPESMALTNLNLEAMDMPVSGSSGRYESARAGDADSGRGKGRERTERRVRLTFTGLAPSDVDVANFIGQLSASSLFEDVNMGYAKNVVFRGRAAREFQANCYVVR